MTKTSSLVAQAKNLVGGQMPEHDHHVEFRSRRPDLVNSPGNHRFISARLHDDIHLRGMEMPGDIESLAYLGEL
jgi:hypothetical protein